MGCYCGLATTQNKIRWALAGLFGFISLCLLIAVLVKGKHCSDDIREANIQNTDQFNEKCDKEDLSDACKKIFKQCGTYYSTLVAFIAFAIAFSVPLYVMCCCAAKPNWTNSDQPAIGLAVAPPPGGDAKTTAAAQYAAQSDVNT